MERNKNVGWSRIDGQLMNNGSEDLLSHISSSLLNGKYTTTYKYCFLQSLLANLFQFDSDYSISLKIIGSTFVSIYWNMINVHHIPQMSSYCTGARSAFEKIIISMVKEKPYLYEVRFESISDDDKNNFVKQCYPEFIKNVIGAFYEDTNGMIYGFSKEENKLWLNEKSHNFFIKTQISFRKS